MLRKPRLTMQQKREAGARLAIEQFLKNNPDRAYVPVYNLSCTADEAAGRELFPSLFDYTEVLPSGCRTEWISTDKTALGAGSIYSAVNPFCPDAQEQINSLIKSRMDIWS